MVLIKSQLMLLSTAIKDPKAYIQKMNAKGPAQTEDYSNWPVERLRAFASANAEKILDLILDGQLARSF